MTALGDVVYVTATVMGIPERHGGVDLRLTDGQQLQTSPTNISSRDEMLDGFRTVYVQEQEAALAAAAAAAGLSGATAGPPAPATSTVPAESAPASFLLAPMAHEDGAPSPTSPGNAPPSPIGDGPPTDATPDAAAVPESFKPPASATPESPPAPEAIPGFAEPTAPASAETPPGATGGIMPPETVVQISAGDHAGATEKA
jgi:hypothetical protein